MPPAVDRSKLPRACDPGPEASGLSTASQSVSSTRGTPARTCRGRSTRPCACGAGLTTDGAAPGQRAVRAAYRSPASSGDVVRHPSGRQPVEGRVDGEADHPHRPGAVDEDVLGDQAPVGDPGRVRDLERARHLADQPGGPARRQRTVVGQQDVERDARRPLVDDEAERGAVARGLVGGLVDVEDPQQAAVHHARGGPGRLAQQARPLVVGADDVHRDDRSSEESCAR